MLRENYSEFITTAYEYLNPKTLKSGRPRPPGPLRNRHKVYLVNYTSKILEIVAVSETYHFLLPHMPTCLMCSPYGPTKLAGKVRGRAASTSGSYLTSNYST